MATVNEPGDLECETPVEEIDALLGHLKLGLSSTSSVVRMAANTGKDLSTLPQQVKAYNQACVVELKPKSENINLQKGSQPNTYLYRKLLLNALVDRTDIFWLRVR